MPIKHTDPFVDPLKNLDLSVNKYANLLKSSNLDDDFPLLYGEKLKNLPGNWLNKIAAQNKQIQKLDDLILEIGSHNGETLNQLASDYQSFGFVGLDITFKRVVKTAIKSLDRKNHNILSVLCNAGCLEQLFNPSEIKGIILFFPDPWIKKKSQIKNRLMDPSFAKSCFSLIKPEGFFWFKTDQKEYFLEGAEHLEQAGFILVDRQNRFPISQNYPTQFEKHFLSQGLETYEGKWIKPLRKPCF